MIPPFKNFAMPIISKTRRLTVAHIIELANIRNGFQTEDGIKLDDKISEAMVMLASLTRKHFKNKISWEDAQESICDALRDAIHRGEISQSRVTEHDGDICISMWTTHQHLFTIPKSLYFPKPLSIDEIIAANPMTGSASRLFEPEPSLVSTPADTSYATEHIGRAVLDGWEDAYMMEWTH